MRILMRDRRYSVYYNEGLKNFGHRGRLSVLCYHDQPVIMKTFYQFFFGSFFGLGREMSKMTQKWLKITMPKSCQVKVDTK